MMKTIRDEPGSEALAVYLDGVAPTARIVSSVLLGAELRRSALRWAIDQSAVTASLAGVDLLDAPHEVVDVAGWLPGRFLRSLDALHLATAIAERADVIVAYDRRLLDAAQAVGIVALSPS